MKYEILLKKMLCQNLTRLDYELIFDIRIDQNQELNVMLKYILSQVC